MNLTAENVNKVFLDCLFKEGERTDNHVIGEGVMMKVGFHPERLKAKESYIADLLRELPNEFMATGGGGWSFLNACMDKHGNHWAEHPTIDQLIALGSACKLVAFAIPRDMWSIFPGGMPYFIVKL